MIGFSKRETRQMEMMIWDAGTVDGEREGGFAAAGQPALLIVAAAAVLGGGLFLSGGRWAEGGDPGAA